MHSPSGIAHPGRPLKLASNASASAAFCIELSRCLCARGGEGSAELQGEGVWNVVDSSWGFDVVKEGFATTVWREGSVKWKGSAQ